MKSFVIAATLIFSLAPLPALAADGGWKADGTYVVRAASAELTTAEGRSVIFADVARAARLLCLNEPTRTERDQCAAEAIDIAVEQGSTPGARDALRLALQEQGRAGLQTAALAAE